MMMESLLRFGARIARRHPRGQAVVDYLRPRLLKLPSLENAYYCTVLSEPADNNLSVNSALTVTCNCFDMDESCSIGSLRTQSFKEILAGPVAQGFREQLAHGKLPLRECSICSALRRTSKQRAASYATRYFLPNMVLLENTVICNLNCIICDRESARKRPQKLMPLDDMKVAAHRIKEAGIHDIWFFGHGEPFTSPRILDELQIVKRIVPDVNITSSTNGLLLNTDMKRFACLLLDELWVSLDGCTEESVVKYQRGGSFELAYRNMTSLVNFRNTIGSSKPHIHWKYVVFNWNDTEELITRAINLAENAGVDSIGFYPAPWPDYGLSERYYTESYFTRIPETTFRAGGFLRLVDFSIGKNDYRMESSSASTSKGTWSYPSG